MRCIRCLYPILHPLGITTDREGLCSGCHIHEEKNKLDWAARWEKLEGIVKPYIVSSGNTYDCIVPVTGANDCYYTVHTVKNRLGLNPLLVTYNKYFNTPLGIRNLANLRIKFDCDILVQNVNPLSVKKNTRTTLREFGSIYWPCIAGQTVFPVQTAVRYKIPLIIWGAHQGVEQVGMFSHEHEVEMTRRYRKDHDLMGFEADDLLSTFDTLSEDDIWQYRYPNDADLHSINVRGIYLSNYVRWDPKAQHEEMIQYYDYKGATFNRTFDTYDHTDCYNYMDIHDYIKFIKWGYTKVTDHACREIRHGRISRLMATQLVNYYQAKPLAYLDKFCKWLEIDERGLFFIMNQHRNRNIWAEAKPGVWIKQNSEIEFLSKSNETHLNMMPSFQSHEELNMGNTEGYVTVGKGYPL